jgi:glutamate-1-semialdehyde aminotransferase/acyl carrier protein
MTTQLPVETFLKEEVAKIMSIDIADIDAQASLLDSGGDSLLMVELLQSINDSYDVSIPVGKVFSELTTINKIAHFIKGHSPDINTPEVTEQSEATSIDNGDSPILTVSTLDVGLKGQSTASVIVQRQLQLMKRQLELVSKIEPMVSGKSKKNQTSQLMIGDNSRIFDGLELVPTQKTNNIKGEDPVPEAQDRFNAFDARTQEDKRMEDRLKNDHIAGLIKLYNSKTKNSKIETQAARKVLADNRASAGFRMSLKEMVYPIISDRTKGSHIWDIDGNEYIDFTMGFGTHLFGHSPTFVTQAIEKQFRIGMPIGPQSPLAGKVADLFCKLTKHDRVVFCNSGTEATMTAVRLARAGTGRDKIAIFSGSYHGTFDGFLARRKKGGDQSAPVAAGVINSMVDDVVVLDYGEDSALAYLREHGSSLAAVIVEPVQSRHPSLQPKIFLQKVRELTSKTQTAFIWDEVITGFRLAPGGAQEYFGIQADIATYGKILGGGMPIGAVGGSEKFLNYIDGGWWQYGDESYPESDMTFFAGTFSKHPLTMASSLAVLQEIESNGAEYHRKLGNTTASMAQELNRFFEIQNIDVRIDFCGSLFRFEYPGNLDLLFFHLMANGVFIWEGRNCFISTAHSDNDIERFIDIVKIAILKLKDDRLVPVSKNEKEITTLPVTASQQRFFDLSKKGNEGNSACNICVGLHLKGKLDIASIEKSIRRLIGRHESLHTGFIEKDQYVNWNNSKPNLELVHSSEITKEYEMGILLAEDQKNCFDLESGALHCFKLYQLGHDSNLLSIAVHHLVCDGMGLVMLIDELRIIYDAELRGTSSGLCPAIPYSKWAMQEQDYIASEKYKESLSYWSNLLGDFDAYRSKPEVEGSSLEGARLQYEMESKLFNQLDSARQESSVSLFTFLLAGFVRTLELANDSTSLVVGIPMATRNFPSSERAIGNCVNILPIMVDLNGCVGSRDLVQRVKTRLHESYRHMDVPYSHLLKEYGRPLFDVSFNLEPVQEIPAFGDASVKPIMAKNEYVEFPLMLNMTKIAGKLSIEVDYQIAIYSSEQVDLLMGEFFSVLESISTPESTIKVVSS